MDKGLDQDTNPTPQQIREYERQGKYRWWKCKVPGKCYKNNKSSPKVMKYIQ
jgi:hypothetical protein